MQNIIAQIAVTSRKREATKNMLVVCMHTKKEGNQKVPQHEPLRGF